MYLYNKWYGGLVVESVHGKGMIGTQDCIVPICDFRRYTKEQAHLSGYWRKQLCSHSGGTTAVIKMHTEKAPNVAENKITVLRTPWAKCT